MNDDPLDEQQIASRLSQITTDWDLVRHAHSGSQELRARGELFQRYHRAAYRYLVAITGSLDAADELYQEFGLRVARGDFRNADPQKGAFRNYLKTTLINLLRTQRRAARKDQPLDSNFEDRDRWHAAEETLFTKVWREELLARAWERLQADEQQGGSPYYTLLRLKSDESELQTGELTARLQEMLGKKSAQTETAVRKMLQRARERFSEHLIRDVQASLQTADLSRVEEELQDLELLPYCRKSLKRMRGKTSD